MKIEINVSEFYFDEDNNLEEALKRNIKEHVINEIWNKINKKVDEQITIQVRNAVEKSLTRHIDENIKKFFETEQVDNPDKYGPIKTAKISLPDYYRYMFFKSSGWSSPEETLKKLAKQFGDEIKARYDMFFASQIVIKLNDNKMLKEDAATALLEDKKP